MIRLELLRLFRGRPWRWAIGIGLSVGLALLSLHWLSTYHAERANLGDLVLAGVSQFYVAAVIVPAYYLFLIADLAAPDWEGYATLFAGRMPSRLAWWSAKAIALGVAAALVLLMIFTVLVGVGLMAGLPFHLSWSFYVRHGGAYQMPRSSLSAVWPQGPWLAVGEWAVLGLGTLASLAWGLLAIGMRLRDALLPWILGIVAASASYAVWMLKPGALRWMPTAQMMLLQHVTGPRQRFFGPHPLAWSLAYVSTLSALGMFDGLIQARTIAFTKGGTR